MEGRIRLLRQRIAWVQHLVKVSIGHKERQRVAELSRYFSPGSVVLDIGAHLGYMTKEFAACYGGSCRVIAFEPIGYTRSILRIVTAAQRNVSVCPYALSDATGCVDISIPLKASGTLGIGLAHIGPEVTRDFVIERAQTTTLDDWFASSNLSTIDFMKVDVEGAELMVLRGGVNTIKAHRPVICMEIDPSYLQRLSTTPEDIFQFMASAGYARQSYTEPKDYVFLPLERASAA